MDLNKSQWVTDGDHVQLSMPLTKIDKDNRIVSGYASLDNADSQGDVITKEANASAFSRFRGNIREMHQPVAVGRMVDFREDNFYDPDTKKFYNGIWVNVYVSKGAQSTWEKVLDGTLQGFSIGGSILDSEPQLVKGDTGEGRMVRFVKDYELVELSLVDSPANKLANVFAITKSADGTSVVTGMIADTNTENVFYCATDKVAKTSSDNDGVMCPEGHKMTSIGWIEYSGADDRTEKMNGVVDNYLNKQEVPATNEGGVNEMAKEDTVVEEVVAPADETKVEKAEEVEAAPVVSEVDAEKDLFEKVSEIKTLLDAGLEKTQGELAKALEGFDEKFEAFKKSVDDRVSEWSAKHGELSEKYAGIEEHLGKMEKALEGIDAETAVKKSGDLGGSKENTEIQKADGMWLGALIG